MGDFQHLLDPHTGVTEHFDTRPGPERFVGFQRQVPPEPLLDMSVPFSSRRVGVGGVDDAGTAGAAQCGIGRQHCAAQGLFGGGEFFPGQNLGGCSEYDRSGVPSGSGCVHESR